MRSIKFPQMFNTNSTNVWKSNEYLASTKQNTALLLQSAKGELLGDPYFGTLLKTYLFDQNNYVLREAITDMIYTQLAIFIPQIKLKRSDIHIVQNKEKGKLYCTFSGINQIDFTTNLYSIALFENSDTI